MKGYFKNSEEPVFIWRVKCMLELQLLSQKVLFVGVRPLFLLSAPVHSLATALRLRGRVASLSAGV